MAKLRAIVAVSSNGIIGVDGKLPWNLPSDLKFFKNTTENGVVIMGRKTWESLPEQHRPLKNRVNIVVTSDPDFEAPGAIVMTSREDVLNYVDGSALKCFVIGGAQIYTMFQGLYHEILITHVWGPEKTGTRCPAMFHRLRIEKSTVLQRGRENDRRYEIVRYEVSAA